jgi:uncharacterized RDD family membrane protein YckC
MRSPVSVPAAPEQRAESRTSEPGGIVSDYANENGAANVRERVAARVVDAFAVLNLTFLTMPSLGDLPRGLMGIPLLLVTAFVVSAAYEILCVGRWGRTLGKRLLDIRVVAYPDGGAVGYRVAAARFLMLAVFPVVLIGFVWAARGAGRRALHDAVVGTIVVRSSDTFPL